IEDSLVPEREKLRLLQDLEEIKQGTEDLTPKESQNRIKDLKNNFEILKSRTKLAGEFAGFSSKIPDFGDIKMTQALAGKISEAMQTGQWDGVLKRLDPNAKDVDKYNLFQAVRQIVGTLYYSLAGKDEGKLDLLLDLFPKNVRSAMTNCMEGYLDNNQCNSAEDRQAFYFYGSGQQTKDRLTESITKDNFETTVQEEAPPREE
ncbi:MAG TPA: hypothetical protein VFW62_09600, partial [bacterium]|nr:hypothetical protein [bacterium]